VLGRQRVTHYLTKFHFGNQELQHGWSVGHVGRGDREYIFVTSYSDRVASVDERPAGWIARDLSKKLLGAIGLY